MQDTREFRALLARLMPHLDDEGKAEAQRWLDCDPQWIAPVVSSEPDPSSPFKCGDRVRFVGGAMTGTVTGFVNDADQDGRVFMRGCVEVSIGELWAQGCTGGQIHASREYWRRLGEGGYNPSGPCVYAPPQALEKISCLGQ
jgi:hypothetical protein